MKDEQLAIEWLENELNKQKAFSVFAFEDELYFKKLFQQAKIIGKDQMIYFANKVLYNAECSFTGRAYLEKDINEFYNETYEK